MERLKDRYSVSSLCVYFGFPSFSYCFWLSKGRPVYKRFDANLAPKITAIFQPHLYTRTRDFYKDFASSLSLLDEVILVDIYPAREQPIPGVTSQLIYDNLRPGIEKCMCKKEEILNILENKSIEVLITLGAGDIDNYVPSITEKLNTRLNKPQS